MKKLYVQSDKLTKEQFDMLPIETQTALEEDWGYVNGNVWQDEYKHHFTQIAKVAPELVVEIDYGVTKIEYVWQTW